MMDGDDDLEKGRPINNNGDDVEEDKVEGVDRTEFRLGHIRLVDEDLSSIRAALVSRHSRNPSFRFYPW